MFAVAQRDFKPPIPQEKCVVIEAKSATVEGRAHQTYLVSLPCAPRAKLFDTEKPMDPKLRRFFSVHMTYLRGLHAVNVFCTKVQKCERVLHHVAFLFQIAFGLIALLHVLSDGELAAHWGIEVIILLGLLPFLLFLVRCCAEVPVKKYTKKQGKAALDREWGHARGCEFDFFPSIGICGNQPTIAITWSDPVTASSVAVGNAETSDGHAAGSADGKRVVAETDVAFS